MRTSVVGDDTVGKPDLRLAVPALAVWAGMWVVTGWVWGIWAVGAAGVVGGVVCAAIAFRHRGRPASASGLLAGIIALMMASCAVVGGLRVWSVEHGVLADAAARRSVIEADVTVRTSRLSASWGMVVVDAVCDRATIGGQTYRSGQPVVVMVPGGQAAAWLAYPAGTVVRATVRLGVSDIGEDAAAVLSVLGDSEVVRPPPAWQRVIESMRRGLVQAVSRNRADQAGLVPGLVVGDTSGMSSTLTADFRATGLTHLTAVSGANLAILLSFLSALARRCGVRGHGLTAISVVGIVVFIALCHSEPSVLRAAAMGAVSLVAVGRGAQAGSGIRGMSLAVMGLCWIDPWMSRSVGFVLSVLACAGIIAWGQAWTRRLSRWLPEWVAQAMAIPLAAQVATQPVICWLSGAVSVAGLMANAAAAPWVAPATVIGLVAAVVSVVSPVVAGWAGYAAGWSSQPILTIGQGLASLPGASHPWPATPIGLAIVTGACIVAVKVIPVVLSRAWAALAVTVVLVAAMLAPPYQPGWPGTGWRVAACDVGQGDAVVVRADQGQAILIDVGPQESSVTRCLAQLGVRQIPLLVLTHFHADHVGAIADVVGAFPVGAALVSAGGGNGAPVVQMLEDHGIGVSVGHTGLTTQIAGLTVTVVSAFQSAETASDGEESASENDGSLIVRVDSADMSLLDTGDVEVAGQQAALASSLDLRVDVLKVPHHGSSRQDPAFLQATQASIALISVGQGNPYGHPADRTVKELVDDGMEVVRTDEHGSIALAHGQTWTITTQR